MVDVIGSIHRTELISPSIDYPSVCNVTFDELVETYFEHVVGLVDQDMIY